VAQESFNKNYTSILKSIQNVYDGVSDDLTDSVFDMWRLSDLAFELLKIKVEGKDYATLPSFEFLP